MTNEQDDPGDDDDAYAYDPVFAVHIARCWRVGQMIGGSETGVRNGLLAEIERLRAALKEAVEWNWLDENVPPPPEVVAQCSAVEPEDKP